MHMMFDEGVAGSFCGNNGSRKTDRRYERYDAEICRSTNRKLKSRCDPLSFRKGYGNQLG